MLPAARAGLGNLVGACPPAGPQDYSHPKELAVKPARHLITAAAAVLLIGGCSDDTGNASEGHILDTQEKAMERAREVEQDLAEAARRQAEQIDRSEEGG